MLFYLEVWDFAQSGRWEGSGFVLLLLVQRRQLHGVVWRVPYSGHLTEEMNGGRIALPSDGP